MSNNDEYDDFDFTDCAPNTGNFASMLKDLVAGLQIAHTIPNNEELVILFDTMLKNELQLQLRMQKQAIDNYNKNTAKEGKVVNLVK